MTLERFKKDIVRKPDLIKGDAEVRKRMLWNSLRLVTLRYRRYLMSFWNLWPDRDTVFLSVRIEALNTVRTLRALFMQAKKYAISVWRNII